MPHRTLGVRYGEIVSEFALILICVLSRPTGAEAGVTFYTVFKNQIYTQTSTAQPSSPSSFFASGQVEFSSASDLSAASVTFSGSGSPLVLSSAGSGVMNANATFASLAAMDVAFPGASYQFAVSGGNLGSQNASLTVPASDLFTAQVPFLSGATYTNLHGMNPALAQSLTWAGYTPASGINDPDIFLTISRFSNGQQVYYSGALSDSQTLLTLPASTLSPNTKYQFELSYSSRINTQNAGFSGASSIVGYDLRAQGTFTTGALPEPTCGLGICAGMMVILRRRSRRS